VYHFTKSYRLIAMAKAHEDESAAEKWRQFAKDCYSVTATRAMEQGETETVEALDELMEELLERDDAA
jgi:hypothetical protein